MESHHSYCCKVTIAIVVENQDPGKRAKVITLAIEDMIREKGVMAVNSLEALLKRISALDGFPNITSFGVCKSIHIHGVWFQTA